MKQVVPKTQEFTSERCYGMKSHRRTWSEEQKGVDLLVLWKVFVNHAAAESPFPLIPHKLGESWIYSPTVL